MAITQGQVWVPTSGNYTTTHTTSGPTTLQGSLLVLIAVCRDRTSTVPEVTDAGGSTWVHAATFRDAGQSTVQHMFYALGANPTTSVTTTIYAADGVNVPTDAHASTLHEFRGVLGFGGAQSALVSDVQTGAGVSGPGVTAEAEALVLSSATAGVTNRTLVPGSGWTELTLFSNAQMRNWRAWRVAEEAGEVVPAWTLEAGASTSFGFITATFTADPNVGGPLTVDVGADRTVGAVSNAALTATVSGGSGTRTFAWTIQSGPAGAAQFINGTAASTTFDPAGVAGVYVLRCTVTDDTGTAFDDVTLTALRNLTFMPMVAVNDSTGWTVTPSGTALAALSDSNDGTYASSADNPSAQILDVQLPPMAVPDQPVQLRLRARHVDAATATVVGRLYTGATLRATSAAVSIEDDSFGQVDITFPLDDLTAITEADWEAGVRATLAFTAA